MPEHDAIVFTRFAHGPTGIVVELDGSLVRIDIPRRSGLDGSDVCMWLTLARLGDGFPGQMTTSGAVVWVENASVLAVQNAIEPLLGADPWEGFDGLQPARRRKRGALRLVELFSFVIPRPVRLRVFAPAFSDLLIDRAEALSNFHSKWARLALRAIFGIRGLILVPHTLWRGGIVGLIKRLLPDRMRRWWSL